MSENARADIKGLLVVREVTRAYGDLRQRTKGFAMLVISYFSNLPPSVVYQVLGKQLLRSGTSIGAHYREAYRARSNAEFISKLETLLQELDESVYWLELLVDSGAPRSPQADQLFREAEELTSIFVASVKTAKARRIK